jgi:isoleucyl-tRNA synthetase
LFGYGPAHEIKRRLLTFWHSVKFLVDYANIGGLRPHYDEPTAAVHPLDRWLVARTGQLVADVTQAYEDSLTHRAVDAFEAYVDDLSNWYIRRSRRRFWDGDEAALTTLWLSLVQALRVIAPIAPFLAEHLWQNLVRGACEGGPESVFLAGWPEPALDEALLAEVAEVRRIVELGYQARGEAELSLRQPLHRMYVRGAPLARAFQNEIAEALNVREVLFDQGPVAKVRVRLKYTILGPRLGAKVKEVQAALDAGEYEVLDNGNVVAAGVELGPEDWERGERIGMAGFIIAEDELLSVAIDTRLDEDLMREKRVRDLTREINRRRKEEGLEITDRIVVTLQSSDADLVPDHGEWIKQETLAVELRVDGAALEIAKV